MRIIGIILAVTLSLMLFASCEKAQLPQKDIMLEVAHHSFEEIFDKQLAEGKKVYGKYCSVCHGIEGKGDGFNSYNLNPRPRDFTDSSFVARFDSTLVIETISAGGSEVGLSPSMPAWGRTLSKVDIRYVAHYVNYLAPRSQAEDLESLK